MGGAKIKAAEGQVLPVMPESSEVAAFSQYDQADDGAYAGDGPQVMIIGIPLKLVIPRGFPRGVLMPYASAHGRSQEGISLRLADSLSYSVSG